MMNLNKFFLGKACVVMFLCCAPKALRAEIEVVGFWKFEAEQAADSSGVNNVAIGEGNSQKLNIVGTPSYSPDSPEGAPELNGSVKLNRGDYLFAEHPVITETDLFGLEVWVRSAEPNLGQNISILGNGRGAPGSGFGIMRTEHNNWAGIFNGVALIEGADMPMTVTNEWTHIALVRDEEGFGTQLYINGKLVYSSERREPMPLSPTLNDGVFVVGGEKLDLEDIRGSFDGNIAAVRVFRFQPGGFVPEDLLFKE